MIKFESKATVYPGPRTYIRLDISEIGLQSLLKGEEASRVWIEDAGDGAYALRADSPIGETRRQGVKASIDVLIEALNDFGDVLDAHHEETPEVVVQAFEDLTERWANYRGERR